MKRLTRISFGSTAALVTNMALVTGMDAIGASRPTIVAALLIAALADNLTDALSIHIYQESERLEPREAFVGTLSNFAARLTVSLTFVSLVVLLPAALVVPVSIIWGTLLLTALTYLLARERQVSVAPEIGKHLLSAAAVLVISRGIAHYLA
jgi:VIT1/CCC1 family predicted Fe2+/Mn2+ transporter